MILHALAFSLLMPRLAGATPVVEPASAARFRMVAEALRQADNMTANWDPGQRDGQVRKVWLDDMREGPPEWRPDTSNPRFVGTFRWRGWSKRFSGGR